MGRNNIPKLDEWREGKFYSFRVSDHTIPESDNGKLISYELREYGKTTNVLSVFWADGFQECLASAFRDGYNKGILAGRLEAKETIRNSLGLE